MTAGFGEHPAVARRRVRLALRKAREANGLSQSEVADRLGWSLSKIQRIELGDVAVSVTDLRALTDLFGGFPAEVVEDLVEATRIARRNRWITKPEYREYLTAATIELMGFEAKAAAIRVYQTAIIPGVLQTPAVAEAIFNYGREERVEGQPDDERIQVRLDVRMLRSKRILEDADAPAYYLVLDEAVLLRDVGNKHLAAEQLTALEKYLELPNVHIRVLGLQDGAFFNLLGSFTLLDLDAADREDVVLYREGWNSDEIIDDLEKVRMHRREFERIWDTALNEDVSRDAIMARAATLRSEVDRGRG